MVNPHQGPARIPGEAAFNQGNSIVFASQIIHLPAPTEPAFPQAVRRLSFLKPGFLSWNSKALLEGHWECSGACSFAHGWADGSGGFDCGSRMQ